jgi:hypothetical protein
LNEVPGRAFFMLLFPAFGSEDSESRTASTDGVLWTRLGPIAQVVMVMSSICRSA